MTAIQKVTKYIRTYMKTHGYTQSSKSFYKIYNDLAFCIQFDMPNELLYATYFVMPLFVPCENRYYTYGNRISVLDCSRNFPLSNASPRTEKWCEELCNHLECSIFPIFDKISTPIQLIAAIENNNQSSCSFFSCSPVQLFRLKMFCYFFIGEIKMLSLTIKTYQQILQDSTFLSNAVRDQYLDEIETLTTLSQCNAQRRFEYSTQTIKNTLSKCFNEYNK